MCTSTPIFFLQYMLKIYVAPRIAHDLPPRFVPDKSSVRNLWCVRLGRAQQKGGREMCE